MNKEAINLQKILRERWVFLAGPLMVAGVIALEGRENQVAPTVYLATPTTESTPTQTIEPTVTSTPEPFIPLDSPVYERPSMTVLTGLEISPKSDEFNAELRTHEVHSWREFSDFVWQDYPHLYDALKQYTLDQGYYFSGSAFHEQYLKLRNMRDPNVIRGLVVIPKEYMAGAELLAEYEQDSFGVWEEQLAKMRADGFDVPDRLNLTFVVMPEKMITDVVHSCPDVNQKTLIPCDSKVGEDPVYWSPGYDWIIYDPEPFTYNSVFMQPPGHDFAFYGNGGWNHEQNHLLGAWDLYHIMMNRTSYIVDGHGEHVPISDYLKGWETHGIEAAYFASDDLMSSIHGAVTTPTALQIAFARQQGIRSTMIDGAPDTYVPIDFRVNVHMIQGKRDITPDHLDVYGGVVEVRDAQKEDFFPQNPLHWARVISLDSGISKDTVESTYMFGASVVIDGEEFTFPIPNVFPLLRRFALPVGTGGELYNLDIHLKENFFETIDFWKNWGHTLIMQTTIMSSTEIKRQGNTILAFADIPVDPSLHPGNPKETYQMVWYVTPVVTAP